MNKEENRKNYLVLISLLGFFAVFALFFVINLIINGGVLPFSHYLFHSQVVGVQSVDVPRADLIVFDKNILESDKFKELTNGGWYEFSTTTLKIGKKEPFGGFGVK